MATKKKPSPAKPKAKAKKPASNLNYAKPKKVVKKSPRPQRLPGMEDAAIDTLETLAHDYADVRDERMGLSKREGELQKDLLAEMKRQKKSHYKHGRVVIDIVPESEKAKVKILKEDADDEPSHEEPDEEPETNDEVAEPEFEPAEV